jgi:hypothetical protein
LLCLWVEKREKAGLIALVRDRYHVSYFSNRELWKWRFESFDRSPQSNKVLFVDLAPCKSCDFKPGEWTDPHLWAADKFAGEHTTVIISSPHGKFPIPSRNFLFLAPSAGDMQLKTEWGTILMHPDYRHRIFMRGVCVVMKSETDLQGTALHYGVDFSLAVLNHHRQRTLSWSVVAKLVAQMWDHLICEEGEGEHKICSAYLDLMNAKEDVLETERVGKILSRPAAEKLLKQLKLSSPKDAFFYSQETWEVPEVSHHFPHPPPSPLSSNFRLLHLSPGHSLLTGRPSGSSVMAFSKPPKCFPDVFINSSINTI